MNINLLSLLLFITALQLTSIPICRSEPPTPTIMKPTQQLFAAFAAFFVFGYASPVPNEVTSWWVTSWHNGRSDHQQAMISVPDKAKPYATEVDIQAAERRAISSPDKAKPYATEVDIQAAERRAISAPDKAKPYATEVDIQAAERRAISAPDKAKPYATEVDIQAADA
jgi:hypothetical protein